MNYSMQYTGVLQGEKTELEQAYERIAALERQNAALQHNMLDALDLCLCRWQPDTTIISVNEKYRKVFGPHALPGVSWLELLPEAERPALRRYAAGLAAHPHTVTTERLSQTGSGSKRHIQWTDTPIFDDAGRVVEFLSAGLDVTERRLAEQALIETDQRFEDIAVTIEEVFWVLDHASQKLTFVSPAFEKIWGASLIDLYLTGKGYVEAILPEDREIMSEARELMQLGEPAEMEYRIRRSDGSIRWIYDRSFPVKNENDEVVRSIGIAADNTAKKNAELALKASETRYRQLSEELEERVVKRTAEVRDLYDNAPIGYHSLDGEGRIVLVNQTHAAWLGFTPQEMIGRAFTDFIPQDRHAHFVAQFASLKERGMIRDVEIDLIRRDGSRIPVLVSATTITNEQGAYVLSRSTVFDNSGQKAADEATHLANQELARAMRMKDEFLASMSHELRTPLTGILGLTESLLLDVYGPLKERQAKALNLVETSGRHLLELINDILDLSKIEAGRLELDIGLCSVDDICEASLILVKGMAGKKHQIIKLTSERSGIRLRADGRRMKQVIVNLLSNAVKFTPDRGKLGVDITLNTREKLVAITVWDQGVGISQKDLQKLFKPFVQVDSGLSRQNTGTGLGLVLSQRIVEAHGGSLLVESEPGQGSRFSIVMPYLPEADLPDEPGDAQPEQADPKAGQLGHGALVMIVDDNQINIDTLGDFLDAYHFRVSSARSGAEFLELVVKERPDVVLMDIQMPGMDGLETIRRLRALPDAHLARVAVIAVTALAMPGDRELCLAAGANEYVSKPLNMRAIKTIISTFL